MNDVVMHFALPSATVACGAKYPERLSTTSRENVSCKECRSVSECPYCHRAGDCAKGCRHQYRQEAGQHKHDGADYLRDLWARLRGIEIPR